MGNRVIKRNKWILELVHLSINLWCDRNLSKFLLRPYTQVSYMPNFNTKFATLRFGPILFRLLYLVHSLSHCSYLVNDICDPHKMPFRYSWEYDTTTFRVICTHVKVVKPNIWLSHIISLSFVGILSFLKVDFFSLV